MLSLKIFFNNASKVAYPYGLCNCNNYAIDRFSLPTLTKIFSKNRCIQRQSWLSDH